MMKSLNCPILSKQKKQLRLCKAVQPPTLIQSARLRRRRVQTMMMIHLNLILKGNLQLHPISIRTIQSFCRCNPIVRKNSLLTFQLHPALQHTHQEHRESEDSQRTRAYDDQANLVIDKAHRRSVLIPDPLRFQEKATLSFLDAERGPSSHVLWLRQKEIRLIKREHREGQLPCHSIEALGVRAWPQDQAGNAVAGSKAPSPPARASYSGGLAPRNWKCLGLLFC